MDFLSRLNPVSQASSTVKYVVGALVVLVIVFLVWILLLKKNSEGLTVGDRAYGYMKLPPVPRYRKQ